MFFSWLLRRVILQNSHKKSSTKPDLVELFKKHYVGITEQSSLLEGLVLCCGKFTPVGMINNARIWGSTPVKYAPLSLS